MSIIINSLYIQSKENQGTAGLSLHVDIHKDLDQKQVKKYIQHWNCSNFMAEILKDARVELFLNQICDFVEKEKTRLTPNKGSPDGIHDIVLYAHEDLASFKNWACNKIIQDTLINKGIVDAGDGFDKFYTDDLCRGVVHKPYTMIQMSNMFLPPIIINNTNDNNIVSTLNKTEKIDLLPPNSFYVQAYIHKDNIKIILNKVIQVSSLQGVAQKSTFTVQERTVDMETLVSLVCNRILVHLQTLDVEESKGYITNKRCQDHFKKGLNFQCYRQFDKNLNELVKAWVNTNILVKHY